MKKNTLNLEYSAEIFISLKKQVPSDAEKRRFQAMEFLASGFDRKYINDSLHLGRSTLGRWVAQSKRIRSRSPFNITGRGAPKKLDDSQVLQIIEEVKRNPLPLVLDNPIGTERP